MNIALLYGGVSVEHVVSCRSAMTVARELKALGHTVIPIAIARDGRWSLYDEVSTETTFLPDREVTIAPGVGLVHLGETLQIDIAFPVTHGSGGGWAPPRALGVGQSPLYWLGPPSQQCRYAQECH